MDLDDTLGIKRFVDSTRQLQQDLVQARQEMSAVTVQGTAGGGAVKATVDGRGALEGLVISPVVADPGDVRGLADMIVSAVRNAHQTLMDRHEQRLAPVLDSLRTELRDISG
ncbi:YbaB/EbfC family nucleoid-associated protein [Actinacidiphila glaucinigra]|uniref:YbaB/EbfC family nucleoid-associated protein n=1 Tax=Actinacidiphila glaucinigra TaxID=235986 RepID=UPI003D9255B1